MARKKSPKIDGRFKKVKVRVLGVTIVIPAVTFYRHFMIEWMI